MIQKWGGGCLIVFVLLALVWKGLDGLKVAATNRSPAAMACADLEQRLPSQLWLSVPDAHGFVTDAAVLRTKSSSSSSEGTITELFIPLHCDGERPGEKSRLVLATKDASLIALMNQLAAAEKNPATLERLIGQHRDQLTLDREFTGLVRAGFQKDDTVQHGLEEKAEDLAPGFVVMDDGVAPSALGSLAWLSGALVAGWMFFRRFQTSPPSPVVRGPYGGAPGPYGGSGRR